MERAGGLSGFSTGDILVFERKFPRASTNYAVYAGQEALIHYQTLSGKNEIVEETIRDYWKREGQVQPQKATLGSADASMDDPVAYPSTEVARRARSQVGRQEYNLVFESSEQFVLWCKYGLNMTTCSVDSGLAANDRVGTMGGAAAGAIIGGAAGSVVPVVGTVIGGLIGAGIGAATGSKMLTSLRTWGSSKSAGKEKSEKNL